MKIRNNFSFVIKFWSICQLCGFQVLHLVLAVEDTVAVVGEVQLRLKLARAMALCINQSSMAVMEDMAGTLVWWFTLYKTVYCYEKTK